MLQPGGPAHLVHDWCVSDAIVTATVSSQDVARCSMDNRMILNHSLRSWAIASCKLHELIALLRHVNGTIAPFDQHAADTALAELAREAQPDRARANDDHRCVVMTVKFLHALTLL
jgi:hypothetical protein